MVGCTGLPCAVTTRPWLSIWKVPSRVYWKVPSGIRILKKPSPRDREVEVVAGLRQRALRHAARRADGLDAAADVDADRQDGALVRGLRADAADVLVDQVLERRASAS